MPQLNTPPQQPQQRIWALRSLQVLLHLAPARLQFQRQPWTWKPGFCPHHLSWWHVWPVPSNYQLQRSPTYHLELQNGAVHWLIDGQEDKPSGKHKKFRLEDMGSPCPITTHNPTLLATSHQNQNITEQWRASFRCCGICALVHCHGSAIMGGTQDWWHTSIYKRIREHRIAAHEAFMNWTLSDFYPRCHNQDPSNLKPGQLCQNPCWQLLASA